MNEQFDTFSSEIYEQEIDPKDLLAHILLRWKLILICLLVGMILGFGIALLRSTETEATAVQLDHAREALTREQIGDVESLLSRFLACQEYQRSLQDDYAQYLSNASRADDYVLLRADYFLSSMLDGLEIMLPNTLLSENDYDLMRGIVGSDRAFSSIYDRVQLSCSRTGSETVLAYTPDSEPAPVCYYFLVVLYGNSEEQCNALLSVVDSALSRTAASLHTLDPHLSFQLSSQDYTRNTRAFINRRITETKNILDNIESQILNLSNNRISKLSADEKKYYDLLSASPDDDIPAQRHVSWKKWIMFGALLGLFVPVAYVFLSYLFDGIVKISKDVDLIFHSKTLQRIFLSGKKNLLGGWAAKLIGIDEFGADRKAEMIAAELALLSEKSGYESYYFLFDPEDVSVSQIVLAVKEKLLILRPSLHIQAGDPAASVLELEGLSASDGAVVFTELGHSDRQTLFHWNEMCTRFLLPVVGTISTEVCWGELS